MTQVYKTTEGNAQHKAAGELLEPDQVVAQPAEKEETALHNAVQTQRGGLLL
jgi:hypothetical protein